MEARLSSFNGNGALCKVKNDAQSGSLLKEVPERFFSFLDVREKKLKKSIRFLICLTLLTTLLSALALEFTTSFESKPVAETSKTSLHSAIDFSVISEERDDVNDHQLVIPAFAFEHFFIETVLPVFTTNIFAIIISSKKLISENALHIRFRSLRL